MHNSKFVTALHKPFAEERTQLQLQSLQRQTVALPFPFASVVARVKALLPKVDLIIINQIGVAPQAKSDSRDKNHYAL